MATAELSCALLAGGTGGAKLAVGLRDLIHGFDDEPAVQPGQLNVIANTGDDIEIYDGYVSPDPDLIQFRLAGVLNAHGFGIVDETHTDMERRRDSGEEIWFELGDADLTVCKERLAALAAGSKLTDAHRRATIAYSTGGASVLPMSDEPVRTFVETPTGWRGIQQFLIQDQSEPEILGVDFVGAEVAEPTPEVCAAIESADLILIGPSNPVISIAPILAIQGMKELLKAAAAPVLAVSPYVAGEILKGPTSKFIAAAGHEPTLAGVSAYYDEIAPGLIDAWIGDEPVIGHPHHLTAVDMPDAELTRAVAAEILRYGASL